MLSLRGIQRIVIVGGGTAGWFAALFLKKLFNPDVEVTLLATPEIPIVGVGEGGILNFMDALVELEIPLLEFMHHTDAVHKLGFVYEGWRDHHRNPKDYYYHMFPMDKGNVLDHENGFSPFLSMLVNHGIPVSYIVDSIALREQNISQKMLTKILVEKLNQNFVSSFHFDTYKVGQFLKEVALQRGVIYREAKIDEITQDGKTGHITELNYGAEKISVDFVVDATGFSRKLIGETFKSEWESFEKYLPANTAIPFHLKHAKPNPDLVTRATAMNAGWVWQIPLKERIGAGYVFNRDYLTEDQAVNEVEKWLGHKIDPIRTINFQAGVFKEVWKGNVLAIGLASGFVEPLEATSIGQTLEQIRFFCNLITHNDGILTQQHIDRFNKENMQAWHGIRDFVRMHYDTGRTDTEFWRDITFKTPLSAHYAELKECWKYRTPRQDDFKNHIMGERLQFGVYSWLAVAQALGLVHGKASVVELLSLPKEKQEEVVAFSNKLRQKFKLV